MSTRKCFSLLLTALLFPLATAGADYEITWSMMDGGGTSTAGTFDLSGTTGPCDTGRMLSGGSFELVGGIWSLADPAPPPPPPCRGDANCDGQIDFADINGFVEALVSGIYCDGTGDNADMDENGVVDFRDINPFVTLLTTNPLPIPCP